MLCRFSISVVVPALSVVVPAKAGTHTPCPIRFARPALIASLGVMGPRLRAGLSGEKLQSLRTCLRDAGLWHSQAVKTWNHELEAFESLESVPRTALREGGDPYAVS